MDNYFKKGMLHCRRNFLSMCELYHIDKCFASSSSRLINKLHKIALVEAALEASSLT